MGRAVCNNANCDATGEDVSKTGYCSEQCRNEVKDIFEVARKEMVAKQSCSCEDVNSPLCAFCNKMADEAANNRNIEQGY